MPMAGAFPTNCRSPNAMVVAAHSAELTVAIELSPSDSSSRGLYAVSLFLAGALSGFGPYVAVFLAAQDWTQQNIGFSLTSAGFAGLLAQLPGGQFLDAIRSKRIVVALGAAMVAAAALIIAFWPSFPLVLAALALQAITGEFLWLAIPALRLCLVAHPSRGDTPGPTPRLTSAWSAAPRRRPLPNIASDRRVAG